MKGKIVFLSIAFAGALAAASAAHAVDVKVFHGNACQPVRGSQAANFITGNANILNENTFDDSNREVVCPIVRDNHTNLNGVKVGVRVSSPLGTTLTCMLLSLTTLGDIVTSDSNSTNSRAVTILPLDIDTSTQGGTYSLFCDLPPVGAVYGYRVSEF